MSFVPNSAQTPKAPMTAVVRNHPQTRQAWVSSLETWADNAIDVSDKNAMTALVERLEAQALAQKQKQSTQVGLQGVAFRFLVQSQGQWRQALMTQPYYDMAQVIQGQPSGSITGEELESVIQQIYEYVDEKFMKFEPYSNSDVRLEVIEVNSVRRTTLGLSPPLADASVQAELMKLGKKSCYLELGDKNAVRGMIGFVGSINVTPVSGADPEFGVVQVVSMEDSGKPIGAYIRGARGEEISIPKRLEHTTMADRSYERAQIARSQAYRAALDNNYQPELSTPHRSRLNPTMGMAAPAEESVPSSLKPQ